MSTLAAVGQARRLIDHKPDRPLISLYVDLDPERFATPPARAAQIRSLIDEARREVEAQDGLSHDDRIALRADVERIDEFLSSPEAPFKGARGLAVFCSGQLDLFEVMQLLLLDGGARGRRTVAVRRTAGRGTPGAPLDGRARQPPRRPCARRAGRRTPGADAARRVRARPARAGRLVAGELRAQHREGHRRSPAPRGRRGQPPLADRAVPPPGCRGSDRDRATVRGLSRR